MAPRPVSRASRVNVQDYRPGRSRYARQAQSAADIFVCDDVPEYASVRRAKTPKEKMQAAMCLRSGYTGYSLPVGSVGRVVYSLTETEAEVLYSMGAHADVVRDGAGEGPIIGQWMLEIFLLY